MQDIASALLYAPAEQTSHATVDAAENQPFGQASHRVPPTFDSLSVTEPAEQNVQSVSLTEPATPTNVPGVQPMHAERVDDPCRAT